VDQNRPDEPNGSDTRLNVRPSSGINRRAFVQFDLSSIPPGSTIHNAVFYINDETGGTFDVYLYPVVQAWDEVTTTWNTQPGYDPTAVGMIALFPGSCVRNTYLDTAIVQQWVDNPELNYGLILYPPEGSGNATFTSREGDIDPILWIEYTPPGGMQSGGLVEKALLRKAPITKEALPPDSQYERDLRR
jgi:hypothetical protein